MTVAYLPAFLARRLPLASTCLMLGMACIAAPVSAQSTGPDTIDATESALTGTYACNGGTQTPIAPVDASTTDISGSNTNNASNLSANACGLPLYSIGTAQDATSASDTPSQDDGQGTSALQQVSLLGGVVTYQSKSETDACNVTDSAGDLSCSDNTTMYGLTFAGQPILGSFNQAQTFYATNLQVQIPGACTGVALFSGSLTVAGGSTQGQNTNQITQTFIPLELKGTITCVGLPLTSVTVDILDPAIASVSAPYIYLVESSIDWTSLPSS